MLGVMVLETQLAQFPHEAPRLLYTPLRASDGYVMVAAISAKNLEALCDAISHPEWKSGPRFATVNAREQNWDQLMSLLEGWTSTRSAEAASNRISNYGVGQG